ncbi:MAG: sugar phosphate isomerase/epimerase [Clostridia bacterium]|nr:sugar phosphate isomerase/epimerase [Clostridia bacterium]
MKLGVLTNLYGNLPLSEVLPKLKALGVEAIELGCGGYPGKAHCDPQVLLHDEKAYNDFIAMIKSYDMEVSALSCHGNPVHPDKATAKTYDDDFKDAVLLAEKMGIDTVITFSGCPGDHEGAKYPNWVTCPWPEDYLHILEYQWNDVLIPYWKKTAAFCAEHGVTKIAFEMHPGFCVYNTETLLKLRAAVGDCIGANFDPSHLIWQGMDICEAIKMLKGCIWHFHAKDTRVDEYNKAKIGVLDTKHYSDELNRAWVFRAVGYGHDMQYWRDIVSTLRLCGYDKVMSIEHEDSLMSVDEGLEKAAYFLKRAIMSSPKPGSMSWA